MDHLNNKAFQPDNVSPLQRLRITQYEPHSLTAPASQIQGWVGGNHCILAAKSRSFERILKWLVSTAVNSYFSNNKPCLFPNSTPHSFLCFPVSEEIPSFPVRFAL